MGYKAKIQRVDRGLTKSFYINLPAAVAEACNIEKGEEMEWLIEDKDTFVLKRVNPSKTVLKTPKKS
jgi:bifunctional DNA-binding transcriptional regulator/antitoxin component of YhaV-PrlF toxin-antitoxin module